MLENIVNHLLTNKFDGHLLDKSLLLNHFIASFNPLDLPHEVVENRYHVVFALM